MFRLKIIRSPLKILGKIAIAFQKKTCKEILVIGDSHAMVFNTPRFRFSFPRYYFDVVSVGGATVSGLENPNSKTQALPIFMDRLKKSNADTLVTLLGEVDTGFVIWYRAEKYQTDVSEMLQRALGNYENLLLSLSKKHRLICISSPLPTISDGQDWGEIANERREIKASQLERTELTLKFNEHMKKFCHDKNIEYIDLDSESTGNDGLIDPRLLNKNPADHHYDHRTYADLIVQKLRKCIKPGAAAEGNSVAAP